MSSTKTPIRQAEMDHIDHFLETKYDDRKNTLKTEMQDIIDKESEDNFEAFKNKLNVNKLHKEVYAFYKDHEKFANEMDTILLEKKGKLDNAINTLEDKLEQWKKVRKWENEISRSLLKQPDELDRLLKKLCHEETTRDFYKGPRGKSLQMLDMSKEYCKNLLNAGQSLATVWKTIDLEMSKEKINTSTIPKPEFLAITK
jgi:predicted RNase H-like nuclease (RuvC/YqgF family)|tara:strand:+ start:108 stop:707 length:600 start_codon:yes stop_codon:yes gene_type:complete